MIYVHKFLPVFFLPVGVSLILLLAGVFARRRSLILSGIAVLLISSTPVVSRLAIRGLEGRAERGLASDAPIADAIVVLSEGRVLAPGKAAVSEWNDGDRFFGGVELYKAGKAPLLVFTGGAVPWEPNAAPEGDVLAVYAIGMGVPNASVATTARVTNTAEEAQAVSALLRVRLAAPMTQSKSPRVLLVTSAFHIRRAQQQFERAGMVVFPFPVDFQVSAGRSTTILDFLPEAGALAQTEVALRELYGRAFYSLVK